MMLELNKLDGARSRINTEGEEAEMRRNQFIELSTQISDLARSIDIHVVPFHSNELKIFSGLEVQAQEKVLNDLNIYLEAHLEAQAEGVSLMDSGKIIWNYLRKIGCRPTSDLFNFVHLGNVVEIHDLQLVQIFRNFAFFRFCSYSIEELYCHPFTSLYRRETEIEAKLIEVIGAIHCGQVHNVIPVNVAPHIISETQSTGKMRIAAEIRYAAPMFFEGTQNVAGSIAIETGKIL